MALGNGARIENLQKVRNRSFCRRTGGLCAACVLETSLGMVHEEVNGAGSPEMPDELGDYQLMEEIGCGGQGVVYRARQKSLNRIVALKVIGLGRWATKAHIKRFRFEAETAASSNIRASSRFMRSEKATVLAISV